jgi:dihydrofolate synthase/folylpolyglutamate synthase
MPDQRTLEGWLDYISSVHPKDMDLGLERVATVAERLGVTAPAPLVVTIAGTNGKGSTTTATEALLGAAGLSVGATLSPHVSRYNERIRLNGQEASDESICRAFERIEEARGTIELTYFEFSALAALLLFFEAGVDVALLEIGLGGRLDAFNLVDADVAVVTSIGLDHADYLGSDLEGIGREKAGIFRERADVVLGTVTESVHEAARALGCRSFCLGSDIGVSRAEHTWDYDCAPLGRAFAGIRSGTLAPDNCALALTVSALVLDRLNRGGRLDPSVLADARLPGRLESHVHAGREVILDVAHNPAAAEFLARELDARWPGGRYTAVYGALEDKDAAGVVSALAPRVDHWLLIPTQGWRGQSAEALAERISDPERRLNVPVDRTLLLERFESARTALDTAVSLTGPGDGILVFGSFSAVEQVRKLLIDPRHQAVDG